ncbi:MAG: histidinol dehydrogenase [Paenibacillaceae bacterium]|nr:histidinol dehydrogenase [Paenibacillaceae bacterium]
MRLVRLGETAPTRHPLEADERIAHTVRTIVDDVRVRGDDALRAWTRQLDGIDVDAVRVPRSVWDEAYERVSPSFLASLRVAKKQIEDFHLQQKTASTFFCTPHGAVLGTLVRPLTRIGMYVPGGTAAYPSSVLMTAVPARVAGVRDIVMVTPPKTAGGTAIDAAVLVAAAEAGVTEMYRVGGAQAIAALAYGTQSIARVDKIVGPGNAFVAYAKRIVYGTVDIDAIAGPSEIVVVADAHADARVIAADLLSQAEHDVEAMAVCVTTSEDVAHAVCAHVAAQLEHLPRTSIAAQALARHGYVAVVRDVEEAIAHANALAPEHLVLHTADPFALLGHVTHAGAIFLGRYSAETVGDYVAGPSHVLPTHGTARFASPLGVEAFLKRSSVIYYGAEALRTDAAHIMTLARAEQLEAHAQAIAVRLDALAAQEGI